MTVTYIIRQSKQQLHWDQIGEGKKKQNASDFQDRNFKINRLLWHLSRKDAQPKDLD